jgi:hypothetical protein
MTMYQISAKKNQENGALCPLRKKRQREWNQLPRHFHCRKAALSNWKPAASEKLSCFSRLPGSLESKQSGSGSYNWQ